MSGITDAYAAAPDVFAWAPRDFDLPGALTIVPAILVRFARDRGLRVYPWYHDLPVWMLVQEASQPGALSRTLQVGFGGMAEWALPGSEESGPVRLTVAGWITPWKEPGALATVVLRGAGVGTQPVSDSLEQVWRTVEAVVPQRLRRRDSC